MKSIRVPCPLCPPKSQKRYALGRGLRAHVTQIHVVPNGSEEAGTKLADDAIAKASEIVQRNPESKTSSARKTKRSRPKWIEAAQLGDIETLESLEKGKTWSWNTRDKHGSIAEHFAAGSGRLECLKYCIEKRRNSCQVHGQESTAELRADSEEKNVCHCHKSEKKLKRNDGRFSIHWACRNNHSHVVKWLLENDIVEVDVPTYDGTTSLHLACLGCHTQLAADLVDSHGARVQNNRWNCDLTHWVGLTNCKDRSKIEEMCSWIRTELSLPFESLNKEGHSIFHKAAFKGNVTILNWASKHLDVAEIKRGCRLDEKSQRPSDIAIRCGHNEYASLVTKFEDPLNKRKEVENVFPSDPRKTKCNKKIKTV
eukprot:CAMPEP_0184015944 /NCGR_PEP_ID=MMETSP0954-20121128/6639_1 /TAXON_ID=627963 /ORGANISM="Aplanochytrium sp, Strain PBS07" /LENGTH=368 /DNA_ID=CAMNT_0026296879 /DNA_START=293 /DNA_END=1399 /DNA_ORIENTATION=+